MQAHKDYHDIAKLSNLWYSEDRTWGVLGYNWKERRETITPIKGKHAIEVLNHFFRDKQFSEERDVDNKNWKEIVTSYLFNPELRVTAEIHCLGPIVDYLYDEPKAEHEADEYETLSQIDIILDASNIAKDDVPESQLAKYDNIIKA